MCFSRLIAFGIGALFVANAATAASAPEGYYRQSWRDKPGDAWRIVGVAELKNGEHPQLNYLTPTYCGSRLTLPEQPAKVQADEKSLVATMTFPPAPQRRSSNAPARRPADRVVEYKLTSEAPGTYTGVVVMDEQINGYTRLERLADQAAVVAELKSSLQRIRAEQIVRDQNVKVAYLWVLRYQREVATEESLSIQAGGGPMPNTRTPLLLAAARATHQTEQAQLLRAQAAEQQVMEMIARAEATPQRGAGL